MQKKIRIKDIIRDMSINPRQKLHFAEIEDYADNVDSLPIIDVFDVRGEGYLLSDGFHRIEAFLQNGDSSQEILCKIHKGTHEDAIEFADKANYSHGLRLSREEKAKVCERAIKRNINITNEELKKEYGIGVKIAEGTRKKIGWDYGAFPSMKDNGNVNDVFNGGKGQDPRRLERPWYANHYTDTRRKTSIGERGIPCEDCRYPISQSAHLLDFAAWGENDHVVRLCTRCHELVDMMIRLSESEDKIRAHILVPLVEEDAKSDEDRKWFLTLADRAEKVVSTRQNLTEFRQKTIDNIRLNENNTSEIIEKARKAGVR